MIGLNLEPLAVKKTTHRLFFALWPPAIVREQLASIQKQVYEQGARKLSPDLFHLTLVYMGAADAEQQSCFEVAANGLEATSFGMTISNTGFFAKPKVAFAGLEEVPNGLRELHQNLSSNLSAMCGVRREARPFNPHVTLLRKYKGRTNMKGGFSIEWKVDRFALVESVSEPSGVVYKPLKFWHLK